MKSEYLGIATAIAATVGTIVSSGNANWGIGLAFVSVVLFFAYLFTKKIALSRASSPEAHLVNLNKHPFWVRASYYSDVKIPSISIPHPLMRKLLCQVMRDSLEIAVKEARKSISSSVFDCDTVTGTISNIVSEFGTVCRKKGVPEVFMAKFANLHRGKVEMAIEYLSFVCNSKFYPTDQEKKIALLDCLYHTFNWAVIDLERATKSLNGEVTAELTKLREQGRF
jgi:hypothetical protein